MSVSTILSLIEGFRKCTPLRLAIDETLIKFKGKVHFRQYPYKAKKISNKRLSHLQNPPVAMC